MASRRWLYDKLRGVFRRGNRESGGVQLRDAFASRSMASVSDLAGQLARGEITLATWSAEMAARVRSTTIAQFVLGVGGKSSLTGLLNLHAARLISEQLGYLRGFTRDIAAGGMTEAQIAARAALYFDTAVGAYERGRALSQGVALPQYPPAHVLCRCFIEYGADGRDAIVSWRTAEDERVCPVCSSLGTRYARIVVGPAQAAA